MRRGFSVDSGCIALLAVSVTYTQYCSRFRTGCPIFISSIVKDGSSTFSLCAHTGSCSRLCPYTIVDRCTRGIWDIFSSMEYPGKWKCSYAFGGLTLDAGTGMNGRGAIFLTLLKVSCPFRGPLSPQQMHTREGLISSRE
jgi:hypothetical protein